MSLPTSIHYLHLCHSFTPHTCKVPELSPNPRVLTALRHIHFAYTLSQQTHLHYSTPTNLLYIHQLYTVLSSQCICQQHLLITLCTCPRQLGKEEKSATLASEMTCLQCLSFPKAGDGHPVRLCWYVRHAHSQDKLLRHHLPRKEHLLSLTFHAFKRLLAHSRELNSLHGTKLRRN